MFGWLGNKVLVKGDILFYGKSGLDFYIYKKIIISFWFVVDVVGNRVSVIFFYDFFLIFLML